MMKSDLERIRKIISTWHALQIQINLHSITRNMVLNDEFSQWAVTTPIYNIGEQVYNISPELKQKYPSLPWNMVSGLRHRLVHDYDGINWQIITEVIFDEMQSFIDSLISIEKEMNS